MIRVHRGEEPAALTAERSRRLASLRIEWIDHDLDPGDPEAAARFIEERPEVTTAGYGVARGELRSRLHKKCAYCEREVSKSDPIDHFRPRNPQRSGPKDALVLEHPGYWWLTWSWDNLLTACTECSLAKGNAFEVSGPRMPAWSNDPSVEDAALIDPARRDPSEHLTPSLNSRGRWTLQGRTSLGRSTARLLRLDRPSDRYDVHTRQLASLVEDIRGAARRGRDELTALWRRKLDVYVRDEKARFRALTRAYLEHHLAALIEAHGLELPSLSDDRPAPSPLALFEADASLEGLEPVLMLRVRARGGRASKDETRALLVDLVQARAWTLDALAALLSMQRRTVIEHVRALAGEGRVEVEGEVVSTPSSHPDSQ